MDVFIVRDSYADTSYSSLSSLPLLFRAREVQQAKQRIHLQEKISPPYHFGHRSCQCSWGFALKMIFPECLLATEKPKSRMQSYRCIRHHMYRSCLVPWNPGEKTKRNQANPEPTRLSVRSITPSTAICVVAVMRTIA